MQKLEKVSGHRDLFLHPNGRYYFRASIKGHGQITRSTGETTLRRAILAVEEMRLELSRLDPYSRTRTYADVAWECFEHTKKKRRWRQRTEAEHRYIFEGHLIPAFGDYLLEDVTDRLWERQLDTWKKKTRRKSFANVRKSAVMVDNFAFRKGYKKSRCDFPIDDPIKREGKVLKESEFRRLIEATDREDVRLFLMMGWYMGMRKNEILGLEKSRVDTKKWTIRLDAEHVKTGSKTGKGRTFSVAVPCRKAILERMGTAGPWIFPGENPEKRLHDIKKPIWSLCKATGIQFKPHDLRHSFLTRKLLDENKPPVLVSEYAGVSLRVIQSVYLHARPEHTAAVVDEGEE